MRGHNKQLFEHLSGCGLHSIQVHYANGWFGKLYAGPPPQDDLFLSKIRLEAATGEDHSKAVDIPKPDADGKYLHEDAWRYLFTHPGRLGWEGGLRLRLGRMARIRGGRLRD